MSYPFPQAASGCLIANSVIHSCIHPMIINPLSRYHTGARVGTEAEEWLKGTQWEEPLLVPVWSAQVQGRTQLWSQQLLHKHVGK